MDEQNNTRRCVHSFLHQLAVETKVSKSRLILQLARTKNERLKQITKRRKQRERLKTMVRDLETTEAQIQLLDETIRHLQAAHAEGTDGEED
jgi:transcriptional antiterminator